MFALRIEVRGGVGVVGLKPEGAPTRLKFDEAGSRSERPFCILAALFTLHLTCSWTVKLSQIATFAQLTLCHHNIRLQDA